MKIRKSTFDDLKRMTEIYRIAREFMANHGNPNQWGKTNWPPTDLLQNDINSGNSYVCLNDSDKVIGTFFFIYGKNIEPTYKKISNGEWKNDSPYGVIHRLAGDGSEKGIGSFCINWAYEQVKHIRIDTHSDNVVMQNILRKLNFTHCGTIYVTEDNYPRLAFEKFEIITNVSNN